MKKTPYLTIAIGFLFLLSTPAFATVWTDIYHEGEFVYLNTGDTHGYTHNINDDGFTVNSDTANWYQIELYLTDDYGLGMRNWGDNWDLGARNDEWVSVRTEWIDLSSAEQYGEEAVYEVDFNIFDPITYSEIQMAGLFALNTYGMLDVELTAIGGDFFFFASKLTASDSAPAPVPEPGTIMLMGIGLVGLARVGRRKFKA